jgi:hypothetical protein
MISESGMSSAAEQSVMRNLHKLVSATQTAAIATLAASIVSARGKPTSINEVLAIANDLQFAMFPEPSGPYKEWAKTRAERLAKVYD